MGNLSDYEPEPFLATEQKNLFSCCFLVCVPVDVFWLKRLAILCRKCNSPQFQSCLKMRFSRHIWWAEMVFLSLFGIMPCFPLLPKLSSCLFWNTSFIHTSQIVLLSYSRSLRFYLFHQTTIDHKGRIWPSRDCIDKSMPVATFCGMSCWSRSTC